MSETVIDERYEGLPGVVLGGYAAGLVAAALETPPEDGAIDGAPGRAIEVVLRAPPPSNLPLDLVREDGLALLLRKGTRVLEARLAAPARLDPPPAATLEQAQRAAADYEGLATHPYPRCFCCGPDRAPGDGLRVFAGPLRMARGVDAGDVLAAPWTPDPALGIAPQAQPPFVWGALDCPAYWALRRAYPGHPRLVTGRMRVEVRGQVHAGTPHVVQAWVIGRRGRKFEAGSAILAADGQPLAVAYSAWFEAPEHPAAWVLGAPRGVASSP